MIPARTISTERERFLREAAACSPIPTPEISVKKNKYLTTDIHYGYCRDAGIFPAELEITSF
jgi:hypothetical protein